MTLPATPPPPPSLGASWCELRELGVLAVQGADAAEFLHGQLSSDIKALRPGHAQYSSYNSPKGRMLATLVVLRTADDAFRILLAADLAESVRKRLAMFVLRSKVSVANAGGEVFRAGVGGPGAAAAVTGALGSAPPAFSAVERDGVVALALPDGRFVVLAPLDRAPTLRSALAAHAGTADESSWQWLAIHAGVPTVTAATTDQFVAQTANWDLLGGVNFQKGCYPGQEIVARTQYLGRLKERLYAFHVDGPPPPAGTRLYAEPFGDQPCGTVVNAAQSPGGGSDLLAVVQIAAVDGGSVRLRERGGPALEPQPLPYAIPAPAAPRGRLA